ncbi:hypothetical protein FRC14_004944 [Serendipita sp. 396]|nr:hypothetical protein FRC14_004944 [Serendipita sp. 396]
MEESSLSSLSGEDDDVTIHLEHIKTTLHKRRAANKRLKERNKTLKTEIQDLRSATVETPPRNTNAASRIKQLEKELGQANQMAAKFKQRYDKLRKSELAREAKELGAFGERDISVEEKYRQTKQLLRRFRDIMEEVVLEDLGEDGEHPDCVMCYEELKPETAAAFPCEHIFHRACIKQLEAHSGPSRSERLPCPVCRKEWAFREVLDVSGTASDQWQRLTDVATEWANIDAKKDDADTEISEQVSEPSFIEDDMRSAIEDDEANPSEQENSDADSRRVRRSRGDVYPAAPATPSPTRAQKRRRLEELAASRSSKRQRA